MINEYAGNMHCHTIYSDGYGDHRGIARIALESGLDFVVVTDHNVYVSGVDSYHYQEDQRVLLLTGEEIHDQAREPQKSHLLVYEARRELAHLAANPQELLSTVEKSSGLSFLAHPVDPAAPLFNEGDLSWDDWDVQGFTGIELWNFMTEFKSQLTSLPRALYYAYNPRRISVSPDRKLLEMWDSLLTQGRRVVAIGGSDAHGHPARMGPLRRVIFPYDLLFRAINTHVLTSDQLCGDVEADRRILFRAIRRGHCFVGNDLPARTHGFRFSAKGDEGAAIMGDSLSIGYGVTLQVRLPQPAEIRLIHNGEVVQQWPEAQFAVKTVNKLGAYRVEAFAYYNGRRRGWIFSNPIFITP